MSINQLEYVKVLLRQRERGLKVLLGVNLQQKDCVFIYGDECGNSLLKWATKDKVIPGILSGLKVAYKSNKNQKATGLHLGQLQGYF